AEYPPFMSQSSLRARMPAIREAPDPPLRSCAPVPETACPPPVGPVRAATSCSTNAACQGSTGEGPAEGEEAAVAEGPAVAEGLGAGIGPSVYFLPGVSGSP